MHHFWGEKFSLIGGAITGEWRRSATFLINGLKMVRLGKALAMSRYVLEKWKSAKGLNL